MQAFPPLTPAPVPELPRTLGDAEVKAAASNALTKFIKALDSDAAESASASRRSRSRSRRRKRSRSRRKKSRSKDRDRERSLLEPPPAPRSKWDEAKQPAWMQDMVEAMKKSESAPPPAPAPKKTDADRPRGHKVIELPAHLIRVLIGKAGSTIREVTSRSGADIKVNHLPHEPQGSISVVGDIDARLPVSRFPTCTLRDVVQRMQSRHRHIQGLAADCCNKWNEHVSSRAAFSE